MECQINLDLSIVILLEDKRIHLAVEFYFYGATNGIPFSFHYKDLGGVSFYFDELSISNSIHVEPSVLICLSQSFETKNHLTVILISNERRTGFEPVTFSLARKRSSQLNYRRNIVNVTG